MPFSDGSCCIEASQLASVVRRLTGFCMVWVLLRVCSEFFLSVLISFIYLNCHWVFTVFFGHVGDICGLQIWTSLLFLFLLSLLLLLSLSLPLLILLLLFCYHHHYYYCC